MPRLHPDARLLYALGMWTLLAASAVVAPALVPLARAAGVVLVAAVLADVMLVSGRPAPRLARAVPERLPVGRASQIELSLQNTSRWPLLAELLDDVPEDLVVALGDRDGVGEAHANSAPRFLAIRVPPGETARCHYTLTPLRRGDRILGTLVALVRSPLGLLRLRVAAGKGEVVHVYPDASRFLRPEALNPSKVLARLGVRPARQRGEGMEFESLREYVSGDDPRHIDWQATARRGRLVTRLHQHERNQTLFIAIDASRLMGARIPGTHTAERTKLDAAIDAALALTYAGLAAGDRVGMAVFDQELRDHLAPRSRRAALGRFVELLRCQEPRLVEADYRCLSRELLSRWPKRALTVILTDFVEADPTRIVAPLSVLARRHRVLVVAIRDLAFDALDPSPPPSRRDERDLYRRIVLDDLLREREETLSRLRRQGLHTLDLAPRAITAQVLNRTLAIRYGRSGAAERAA